MADGNLQSRLTELERAGRFEGELRELTLSVTRSLLSTLNLPASLARLCHAAAPLFGAHRAVAWMHDRRARELVLEASSDTGFPETVRMPLAELDPALANTLRHNAPAFVTVHGVRALAIPLRGRRRALGVLVLERLSADPASAARRLDAAAELGRQVSTAIENTILFAEVLRSRRELEDTFNSLGDLVVVCDRRLRVINANRAFRERLVASAPHPIDRPIADLVGRELAEWLKGIDLAHPPAPPHDAREFADARLGGPFAVRVTPLHGADGAAHGLVVVARDQAEQVRLEAERAALRDRLLQAEKLAALGQFVAGVAHELNNPLQGVLGHLELLRATGRVPRALQSDLRVVSREADRAARIITNLLVFAGSRTGGHRRLNLNAVVTRTAAARARVARQRGIAIKRTLDARLPRVRGDSALLQQALLNIIINAEHAIASVDPGRGEIRITTRAAARGTRAVVEVRDTGPGIAAGVLPRIFEPFFTTKGVGEGTGLGLALTYGIVHDHAGEITARNVRGGGAVFRILLPADTMGTRRPDSHD